MVRTALTPDADPPIHVDASWVSETADRVLSVMERSRATWQTWHVRAEVQRQVRAEDVPTDQAAALIELLIAEVIAHRCLALAPSDGIEEPEALRRIDGTSVYTIAGADRYTSRRVLDAEQHLIGAAARRDGAVVVASAVDLALLELAANGTRLDHGQAALVREMCTSGARMQLAIAPAGAGKTTAMQALTLAWTQDGGQVLGLAPSAAAAAVLAEQTGICTDTLAKLTWSLRHDQLPEWAAAVGPSTLIIIDEAGMADTLSLDATVQFALDRGASVRLIGDDQQLAAIGAGGVLRDIKHMHGAPQLTELHRFTDPAEAQASLSLRDGDPNALAFYLDHGRVHVGDLARTTEDAFTAWVCDRKAGLDAIMLAPTRDLVADLNHRARSHRLRHTHPSHEVQLADGNQASVGDVIITRTNDRQLRLSATDWVKNGDRWIITRVDNHGGLTVRHQAESAHLPIAHRLRPDVDRSRLRQYDSRRPRRLRRHHARNSHRPRIPAAALHDAEPRPARQPRLPSGRRRRRPAQHDPTRRDRTAHTDRDAAADLRPRRLTQARRRPACANSTTPPHSCTRPSSATPTASTPPPNTSSDPNASPNSTPSTNTSPASPTNPPGPPCEPDSSNSPPRPAGTHFTTSTRQRAAFTSNRSATWPPSSAGDYLTTRPQATARSPGSPKSQRNYGPTQPGATTSTNEHNS